MTDGCGYIAVDLAKQCPLKIVSGWKKTVEKPNEEHPLLIQCRVIWPGGLAKGVLIANPNIPAGEIHLRDSMIKIRNQRDSQHMDTRWDMEYAQIEVNNVSTIGNHSTLNISFNIILSELVNEKLFREYIYSN